MHNAARDADGDRQVLRQIARQAMQAYGLLPDFSPAALGETERARPAEAPAPSGRDLRDLQWCSIDNDDSLDLDQLSVSAPGDGGATRILVAIADVDGTVAPGGAIDEHARHNTTSVYTPAIIFPMLPEHLSTDLTSLAFDRDRAAVVVDMAIDAAGSTVESTLYRAVVRNRAKLAYTSVAAWLDGQAPMPPPVAAVPGMADQLRVQADVAGRLRRSRFDRGALDLQTIETRALFEGNAVRDLAAERDNRARDLIEDFMIAANSATARFLEQKRFPSVRRIVRSPKRWDRIEVLASQHGGHLPPAPDSRALAEFLSAQRAADPVRFPDLCLSVIKLLGSGEYVVERPGEDAPGHFGLAVKDYAHSTAPNRRYPDLVTQRLVKAALAGAPVPSSDAALDQVAAHCTDMEDEARKVERLVKKSAAALLLESKIGEVFDGIVTGASTKGTWARVFHPPVEGRLVRGFEGLDVGDRVRVKLVHTDVQRGFIDFARAQ
jgi:exoribonuclease-2